MRFLTRLHLLLIVFKSLIELGEELLHRSTLLLFSRVGPVIIVHSSFGTSFIVLTGGEKVLLRR